jgi:hypothetical protein
MGMTITQHMAHIIAKAAGDPGGRMMCMVLEEDAPEVYRSELFHCLEHGLVVRMDATGAIQATSHGVAVRRAAINAGDVRA